MLHVVERKGIPAEIYESDLNEYQFEALLLGYQAYMHDVWFNSVLHDTNIEALTLSEYAVVQERDITKLEYLTYEMSIERR